jgi:hypothetical protein
MNEAQGIGKVIYEQVAKEKAAAGASASGGGTSGASSKTDGTEGGSPKDDNVIDAEFEVKDAK